MNDAARLLRPSCIVLPGVPRPSFPFTTFRLPDGRTLFQNVDLSFGGALLVVGHDEAFLDAIGIERRIASG